MNLKFEKELEDARGKMLFFSYGSKKINLMEIKKGFARGGHYYANEQLRIIVSGKIEYREENALTGNEKIRIVSSPDSILIPPNGAHLFVALEDTIFVEVFDEKAGRTSYPKYRQIVEEKMRHVD